MLEFIRKHAAAVTGVLNGFDRVLFRGTFRNLIMGSGIKLYLSVNKILFKDAGKHFDKVSQGVKEASVEVARRQNRPMLYLDSARESKEDIARAMAARDGIMEGLIGALTCGRVKSSCQCKKLRDSSAKVAQRPQRTDF
jgi:hypothetical protein